MYYYWGSGHYWRSSELFDAWTIVAAGVAIALMHGVWRLWRGMRLDAFERTMRSLRQKPATSSIEFPSRRRRAPQTRGFQISLLPLMLVSCGLAMLLAQAQRPDDVSRPVTWALFLGVGAWYGAGAWSHRRGFGPLRNEAFAAIATTTVLSAVLWGFYLLVDIYHAEPGYQRLTTSVPILLWWTAVGGAVGGLIGSFRASRIYHKSHIKDDPSAETHENRPEPALESGSPTVVRKIRWRGSTAAICLACLASLVVHLAAVPHVYQSIDYRYVWWDHYHAHWDNTLTLTMAPSSRPNPWVMPVSELTFNDIEIEEVKYSEANFTDSYNGPAPIPNVGPTDVSPVVVPESRVAVDVYVAKRQVPAGTRLTAAMFMGMSKNMDRVPPDLVDDLDTVVGSVASRDIAAGATLLRGDANVNKLAASNDSGLDLNGLQVQELKEPILITGEVVAEEPANRKLGFRAAAINEPIIDELTTAPQSPQSPQSPPPPQGQWPVVLTTNDGRVVEGRFVKQDDQSITIIPMGASEPISIRLAKVERIIRQRTTPQSAATRPLGTRLRAETPNERVDSKRDWVELDELAPRLESTLDLPRDVKGPNNPGPRGDVTKSRTPIKDVLAKKATELQQVKKVEDSVNSGKPLTENLGRRAGEVRNIRPLATW